MFIFALLLITKFESTNLMNINEKWALGLYTSNLTFSGYFLSLKIAKTVTLGMEGNVGFYNYNNAQNSTITDYIWNGTFGITLSKYFYPSKPLSPFIAFNPNFRISYHYYGRSDGWSWNLGPTYGINLNTGFEYFFTCWGKNLGVQLSTLLIRALRNYVKTTYSHEGSSENSSYFSNDIDIFFPLRGGVSTYICLYY